MQYYVDGVTQRGATPILVTPVARYSYTTNEDGTLKSFVGNFEKYGDVMRKMAKEQNLSLNPTKISGVCGRLMCCLKNEQDTYEELNSHLPNVGDSVTTPDKLVGEVSSVNVLRQRVKVLITHDNDEKELKEYPVEELRFKKKRRFDKVRIDDDKELKALEELERKEGKAHISDD